MIFLMYSLINNHFYYFSIINIINFDDLYMIVIYSLKLISFLVYFMMMKLYLVYLSLLLSFEHNYD